MCKCKQVVFVLVACGYVASAQQPKIAPDKLQKAAAGYSQAVAMLNGVAVPNGQPVVPEAQQGVPADTSLHKLRAMKEQKKTDDPIPVERIVPVPANVQPALAISTAVLSAAPQVSRSADGRVVYAYGSGTFPIVCAPLQITEIDFEAGEVVDERNVDIGDSTIDFALHHAGSGLEEFAYLDLQPRLPNVDTTMTVGTSKRVYYFHVIASAREHLSRIVFSYPAEEAARLKAQAEAAAAAVKEKQEEAVRLSALAPPTEIHNWKYVTEKHGKEAFLMEPTSVGDDGSRTYIQLSDKVRKLGLPVIQVEGAVGPLPANWHWENTKLIVDSVFQRACLLNGVGRKQQRVCITNEEGSKQWPSN